MLRLLAPCMYSSRQAIRPAINILLQPSITSTAAPSTLAESKITTPTKLALPLFTNKQEVDFFLHMTSYLPVVSYQTFYLNLTNHCFSLCWHQIGWTVCQFRSLTELINAVYKFGRERGEGEEADYCSKVHKSYSVTMLTNYTR